MALYTLACGDGVIIMDINIDTIMKGLEYYGMTAAALAGVTTAVMIVLAILSMRNLAKIRKNNIKIIKQSIPTICPEVYAKAVSIINNNISQPNRISTITNYTRPYLIFDYYKGDNHVRVSIFHDDVDVVLTTHGRDNSNVAAVLNCMNNLKTPRRK